MHKSPKRPLYKVFPEENAFLVKLEKVQGSLPE